jgi:hypothetical protein
MGNTCFDACSRSGVPLTALKQARVRDDESLTMRTIFSTDARQPGKGGAS